LAFYTVKTKFGNSGKIVVDYTNGEIEVFVTSIPYRGKANREILVRISDHFGVKWKTYG